LYEVLPDFIKWRKAHCDKIETTFDDPKDKTDFIKDGYYDFKDEEWPKVLPFLAGGYPLNKKCIDQVSADFIHSIRILIKGSTKMASMMVCDGKSHTAVPFIHLLVNAPSVSHIEGRPMVHLIDQKVDVKQYTEDVGAFVKEATFAKVTNSQTDSSMFR